MEWNGEERWLARAKKNRGIPAAVAIHLLAEQGRCRLANCCLACTYNDGLERETALLTSSVADSTGSQLMSLSFVSVMLWSMRMIQGSLFIL